MGCGTGYLVHLLTDDGFVAHGLDKSQKMIDKCNEDYDNKLSIKCGDANDPLEFEPSSFSHILCTNFTIYEFDDKKQIFSNANRWLKHNGYFVVHCVEPSKFDTTIPAAKPTIKMNPQEYSNQRVNVSKVVFDGYSYQSTYTLENTDNSILTINEIFEDFENKQKRENEKQLYMCDLKVLEKIAQENGFHLHSKATMKTICGSDKHQYLYIFEKIH